MARLFPCTFLAWCHVALCSADVIPATGNYDTVVADLVAENARLRQRLDVCQLAVSSQAPARSLYFDEPNEVEELMATDLSPEKVLSHFLLAVATIGFVVLHMVYVFVTNWKDAEVRSSVFKLVHIGLSTFLAVLINNIIFNIVLLQLIPCEWPRGLGKRVPGVQNSIEMPCGEAPHTYSIAVALFFFFFFFLLLNCLVRMETIRESSNKTFVWASIHSHLIGFAAVNGFGDTQYHWNKTLTEAWMVVGFALLAFGVMSLLMFHFPYCGRRPFIIKLKEAKGLLPDEKMEGATKWSEQIAEAEDHGLALCLGFLISQVACKSVLGKMMPVEEDDFLIQKHERDAFMTWELGFFFVFFCFGVALMASSPRAGEPSPRRFAKACQNSVGMALAWTVFRHGDWWWRSLLYDLLNARSWGSNIHLPPESVHLIARISNAFFLSVCCLVFVFATDILRNVLEGNRKHVIKRFDFRRNKMFAQTLMLQLYQKTINNSSESSNQTNYSELFCEVHKILSFLIGVCWERAFTEANAVCADGFNHLFEHRDFNEMESKHPIFASSIISMFRHPIIARCLFGSLIVFVVGITWWKFVAPFAIWTHTEHVYSIIIEVFASSEVKKGLTRSQFDALCQLLYQYQPGPNSLDRCKCHRLPYPGAKKCCELCKDGKDSSHKPQSTGSPHVADGTTFSPVQRGASRELQIYDNGEEGRRTDMNENSHDELCNYINSQPWYKKHHRELFNKEACHRRGRSEAVPLHLYKSLADPD